LPQAWLLLVVGLCILLWVAVDVAYLAVYRRDPHVPSAVNAQYPLPTAIGVLHLHDPIYSARAVATVGGPCKGLRSHTGILGGTPVVVKDQTGAVIATGALDIGQVSRGSVCDFAFDVQLPKADAYEFQVLNRTVGTYRYDQLDSNGWQVGLSLG
jgi:hypothetical protein